MPAMRRLLPLLLLAAAAPAEGEPDARDIFRRAVGAQGSLKGDDVHGVRLEFKGEITDQGVTNTVLRTYWYRKRDRSFRVRTASGAVEKLASDRGVFGTDGYWERATDGAIVELRRGNRDDLESIRTIKREREEFQRMLRMVLLAGLDGDGWSVELAEPLPVKLDRDLPYQPKGTLRDREKETYHVLDMTRADEPRLRLYVHTGDFTVRKAIEFDAEDPGLVRWVYYFANYERNAALDLLLPRYFSIYRDTPLDDEGKTKLNAARGEPTVALNPDLVDADLRPAP
jgi:hypothetical protein